MAVKLKPVAIPVPCQGRRGEGTRCGRGWVAGLLVCSLLAACMLAGWPPQRPNLLVSVCLFGRLAGWLADCLRIRLPICVRTCVLACWPAAPHATCDACSLLRVLPAARALCGACSLRRALFAVGCSLRQALLTRRARLAWCLVGVLTAPRRAVARPPPRGRRPSAGQPARRAT